MKDSKPRYIYGVAGQIIALCVALMICGIITLLESCSHIRYVEVPSVTHDSVTKISLRIDSFFVKDSVYTEVVINGRDTSRVVYRDRNTVQTKLVKDTMVVIREDTVSVPVPVVQPISGWQSNMIRLGEFSLAAIIIALLAFIFMLWKRVRYVRLYK